MSVFRRLDCPLRCECRGAAALDDRNTADKKKKGSACGTAAPRPIMDRAYEFIRVRGDNRESADPLFTSGSLPVFPDARQREWFSAFHPDGIGLLRRSGLDRFPFKKIINRNKAASVAVSVSETG